MYVEFTISAICDLSLTHVTDPSCVLLPPQQPSSTVSDSLHNKIMVHLATRLSTNTRKVTKAMVKKSYQPSQVSRWYKVRRLEGGDDMVAATLAVYSEDRRDATYIRVCPLLHISFQSDFDLSACL